MSFNASVVMVRGNHLHDLPSLLLPFGPQAIASTTALHTWDAALEAAASYRDLADGISRKVVTSMDGWTVVLDPEAVLWTDIAACEQVSAKLASPLFAMACNGVVSSYAYRYFDPDCKRRVWVDSGTGLVEDIGKPIPEEKGISLKRISEREVLSVMAQLGCDYASLEGSGHYLVCDLEYGSEQVAEEKQVSPPKPWWKVW